MCSNPSKSTLESVKELTGFELTSLQILMPAEYRSSTRRAFTLSEVEGNSDEFSVEGRYGGLAVIQCY